MQKLSKDERPKYGKKFPFRTDKPIYRMGNLLIGAMGDDYFALDGNGKTVSFARTITHLRYNLQNRAETH